MDIQPNNQEVFEADTKRVRSARPPWGQKYPILGGPLSSLRRSTANILFNAPSCSATRSVYRPQFYNFLMCPTQTRWENVDCARTDREMKSSVHVFTVLLERDIDKCKCCAASTLQPTNSVDYNFTILKNKMLIVFFFELFRVLYINPRNHPTESHKDMYKCLPIKA